jgi:hypothetical protein
MTDTASTESKTRAHHVGANNVREQVGDLSTGIDMLIARLDDILTNIMNEEDAFRAWQYANWIAFRLKDDAKRIDDTILAKDNEWHEAASQETVQ